MSNLRKRNSNSRLYVHVPCKTWKMVISPRRFAENGKEVQSFCFDSLNMQNLWRCRCRRVVDLKLSNDGDNAPGKASLENKKLHTLLWVFFDYPRPFQSWLNSIMLAKFASVFLSVLTIRPRCILTKRDSLALVTSLSIHYSRLRPQSKSFCRSGAKLWTWSTPYLRRLAIAICGLGWQV